MTKEHEINTLIKKRTPRMERELERAIRERLKKVTKDAKNDKKK